MKGLAPLLSAASALSRARLSQPGLLRLIRQERLFRSAARRLSRALKPAGLLRLIRQERLSRFECGRDGALTALRLFYGLLAISVYPNWMGRALKSASFLEDKNFIWPALWVDFFNSPSLVVLIFFISGFVISLSAALFPYWRPLRLLGFLIFFVSLSSTMHPGRIFHSWHGALFASFFFVFLDVSKGGRPEERGLREQRNRLMYFMAQGYFLMTYSLAGLWKIRGLSERFFKGDLSLESCLPIALARQYAERNAASGANPGSEFYLNVLSFLEAQPSISALLWLGGIIFQTSCFAAAFFPKLLRPYGCMIILFHVLTEIFMNLSFAAAEAMALIILIIHPWRRKDG